MLFLFRRLHNCNHKYSCIENVLRKFYDTALFFGLIRIPLKFLASKSTDKLESKWAVAAEVIMVLVIGCLRSVGCLARFMNEEIIQPPQ
jgi:hypothetical protein